MDKVDENGVVASGDEVAPEAGRVLFDAHFSAQMGGRRPEREGAALEGLAIMREEVEVGGFPKVRGMMREKLDEGSLLGLSGHEKSE